MFRNQSPLCMDLGPIELEGCGCGLASIPMMLTRPFGQRFHWLPPALHKVSANLAGLENLYKLGQSLSLIGGLLAKKKAIPLSLTPTDFSRCLSFSASGVFDHFLYRIWFCGTGSVFIPVSIIQGFHCSTPAQACKQGGWAGSHSTLKGNQWVNPSDMAPAGLQSIIQRQPRVVNLPTQKFPSLSQSTCSGNLSVRGIGAVGLIDLSAEVEGELPQMTRMALAVRSASNGFRLQVNRRK